MRHDLFACIFLGSLLFSCAKNSSQEEVFHFLGQEVIVPTLADFSEQSQILTNKIDALCAQPTSEHLEEAQQAWRKAHDPWSRSEAFALGPVAQLGVKNRINFWPARTDTIEATLAQLQNPDASVIEQIGASAKGLPALEYLLFDMDFTDSTALEKLMDPMTGANRCAYTSALAQNLWQQATELQQAWIQDPGGFLTEFVNAGQGMGTYPKTQDGVDILVNTLVAHLTLVVMTKLEKPLAAQQNGESVLEVLESRFSDTALADLHANLLGVAAVYRGYPSSEHPRGLSSLVREIDPDLDARIQTQLDETITEIENFPMPLRIAFTDDIDRVEALHAKLDELRRLFKLDVVSVLSVTLTLTDNDGD